MKRNFSKAATGNTEIRLAKEQITICIDSQAAVAALAASGTKLLLVADSIEKLTVLSEVNQVTIMLVPEHSGIQQNETADRLAREGARSRTLLTTILKQVLVQNWIEKRRQN